MQCSRLDKLRVIVHTEGAASTQAHQLCNKLGVSEWGYLYGGRPTICPGLGVGVDSERQ
jgi:hypothetical protein